MLWLSLRVVIGTLAPSLMPLPFSNCDYVYCFLFIGLYSTFSCSASLSTIFSSSKALFQSFFASLSFLYLLSPDRLLSLDLLLPPAPPRLFFFSSSSSIFCYSLSAAAACCSAF